MRYSKCPPSEPNPTHCIEMKPKRPQTAAEVAAMIGDLPSGSKFLYIYNDGRMVFDIPYSDAEMEKRWAEYHQEKEEYIQWIKDNEDGFRQEYAQDCERELKRRESGFRDFLAEAGIEL